MYAFSVSVNSAAVKMWLGRKHLIEFLFSFIIIVSATKTEAKCDDDNCEGELKLFFTEIHETLAHRGLFSVLELF